MTKPLRTELIEAGARELLPTLLWLNETGSPTYVTWSAASDAQRDHALEVFAQSFDAALDALDDEKLRWFDEAGWTDDADDLIAVLRGPQ